MPIELLVTPDWQIAISDAVKHQNKLETITKEEERATGEHIRPIVLFQAQHDSQRESTINVEEVKKLLLNKLKIPDGEIAVATGAERGIEGVNLLANDCKIRYIITKQALKEGWDCPFAYVFCSVAKVSSSKDVEQLLGRVLRMPQVQRKKHDELNRAYAFVSSNDFYNTAKNLQDSLIQSGFSAAEVSDLIKVSPAQLPLAEYFGNVEVTLTAVPDFSKIDSSLKDKIVINQDDKTLIIKESITASEKEIIKSSLSNNNDKEEIERAFRLIQSLDKNYISPRSQEKRFSVPQLLFNFENEYRVFDEEVLLPANWNLAECDSNLTEQEFPVKVAAGEKGLIDLDQKGNLITYYSSSIQEELNSILVSSTMDKIGLIQWLVKECRHQSILYSQIITFVSRVVENLISSRQLQIEHLVFMRFKLKHAVKQKILTHYVEAKKKGYQQLLFVQSNVVKDKISNFMVGHDFVFPDLYPAFSFYTGNFHFTKHYHEQIGELNNEEAECAFNIDKHPNVDYWIRNLERQEYYSFWLQTSTDKFYPDFVVKLVDGTIVIVEYKGADRYPLADSIEKRQLGEFYARVSDGKCQFIMLNGKDWKSLSVILSLDTKKNKKTVH